MPLLLNKTTQWTDALKDPIRQRDLIELTNAFQNPQKAFGREGRTILTTKDWRLDIQDPPNSKTVNLQIQKNDKFTRPSTVACLLLPADLYLSDPKFPGPAKSVFDDQSRELRRRIVAGLEMSAYSHRTTPTGAKVCVCQITGTYANSPQGRPGHGPSSH